MGVEDHLGRGLPGDGLRQRLASRPQLGDAQIKHVVQEGDVSHGRGFEEAQVYRQIFGPDRRRIRNEIGDAGRQPREQGLHAFDRCVVGPQARAQNQVMVEREHHEHAGLALPAHQPKGWSLTSHPGY